MHYGWTFSVQCKRTLHKAVRRMHGTCRHANLEEHKTIRTRNCLIHLLTKLYFIISLCCLRLKIPMILHETVSGMVKSRESNDS